MTLSSQCSCSGQIPLRHWWKWMNPSPLCPKPNKLRVLTEVPVPTNVSSFNCFLVLLTTMLIFVNLLHTDSLRSVLTVCTGYYRSRRLPSGYGNWKKAAVPVWYRPLPQHYIRMILHRKFTTVGPWYILYRLRVGTILSLTTLVVGHEAMVMPVALWIPTRRAQGIHSLEAEWWQGSITPQSVLTTRHLSICQSHAQYIMHL